MLVLATSNPHKVTELRAILAAAVPSLDLLALDDPRLASRGSLTEPAETGHTFLDNATIKALSYAVQTGLPCLADDSGLEVDALGGAPGVISSHYATDGRETGLSRQQRDDDNRRRVLRELDAVPLERRTARFVCVMALAAPVAPDHPAPRLLHTSRGTCEGRIGLPAPHAHAVPRGTNGFGYDPLFLVADAPYLYSRTSAELSPAEKNLLSHRARAARQMAEWLRANPAR
ncbi:MAG: non-canonical purine NTP pyrophosphatase [Phycisphaerales bacterium]